MSGSLVNRAKALVPILIPLIVSSFKRAEELATAMECRCYRGDNNRTKLVKLEFKARDFVFFLISLVSVAGIILLSTMPHSVESLGWVYDLAFYKI